MESIVSRYINHVSNTHFDFFDYYLRSNRIISVFSIKYSGTCFFSNYAHTCTWNRHATIECEWIFFLMICLAKQQCSDARQLREIYRSLITKCKEKDILHIKIEAADWTTSEVMRSRENIHKYMIIISIIIR